MAVANAKANAEQKAKVAAEKERKRKEKKEKKEKEAAEREQKMKAMASMGLLLTADGKPRKRDVFIDGPAKPDKPDDLEAAKDALEFIRGGNENVCTPVSVQYYLWCMCMCMCMCPASLLLLCCYLLLLAAHEQWVMNAFATNSCVV